ncbi:MAG: NYN domain-containing protein [Acidiferrobacteraceae bacterium]
MLGNYYFIDGSALTSQIRQLQKADSSFRHRRLCPKQFIAYFNEALPDLHANQYKRATFYFPKGDETAIEDYLVMPDRKKPAEIRDLYFKFCGQKLKRSDEFKEFVETLVPNKFKDRFSKSEKGIDIEICCDAFKLASASRLDRLFLLTNDDDFVPFCRAIKEFGANISIIHLSEVVARNVSLLCETDSYDVIPVHVLQRLFLPVLEHPPPAPVVNAEQSVSALKPDVSPSDLIIDPSSSPEEIHEGN